MPLEAPTLMASHPKRIFLPRFDTLGDIVLLEGLLKSLQQSFPQVKLTLLVRKGCEDLAPLFPKTIEWFTTELNPYSDSPDASLCEKLLDQLGTGQWDLVLATSYNRTWADHLVAARLTGAKRLALGKPSEISSLYRDLFTRLGLSVDCPYDRFIPVDETSHETEKYPSLWRELSGKSKLPEPRLSVPETEKRAAKRILDEADLKSGNFCLCFPAGTQRVPIKAWLPERFAEIITWMERKYQLPSLVAGHESEADCIQSVVHLAQKGKANPRIWLGKDGQIPTFAALAAAAKMYVGNDTGPMHIAAAVNTPVVAVFGGGTWPRFRPLGSSSLAVAGEMPCFGCGWNCLFTDAPCMSLVAVKDVKKAVESVYDGSVSKSGQHRVIPASTKLTRETQRYIKKAVATHRLIEADRADRLEDTRRVEQLLKKSDADRAARLEDTRRVEQLLKKSEADREKRLEDSRRLVQLLKVSEADRAARLEVIQELDRRLKESEEGRKQALSDLELLRNSNPVRHLLRLGLVSDPKTSSQREKKNE